MILINGNWEKVETLLDVAKIVKEYYNPELARKIEDLYETYELETEYLRGEIDYLEDEVSNLYEGVDDDDDLD